MDQVSSALNWVSAQPGEIWFAVGSTLTALVALTLLALRRSSSRPSATEPSQSLPRAAETRALAREIAPKPPISDIAEIAAESRESWASRLKAGLTRARGAVGDRLQALITGKTLSPELLEQIHETLFRADLGVQTTDRLVENLKSRVGGQTVDWGTARQFIGEEMTAILSQSPSRENASALRREVGPLVVLVIGVNGAGKTTSIGKLAALAKAKGLNPLLAAADTYRAAAIEQLGVWGERLGVDVIRGNAGGDPAAVAHDAVKAAVSRRADVLFIDTAGRLHNKENLMAELAKMSRVLSREIEGAPHEVWLVLDATSGQNAVAQARAFNECTKLTGIIATKLDGTAKAGFLLGVAESLKLPIVYCGVGEKVGDLRAFDNEAFVAGLLGG